MRDLPNVAAEWTLLATAFNLSALWRMRPRRRGRILSLSGGAGGYHRPSRRLASTHEALPTASMTRRKSLPPNMTLHLKQALQTRLWPRQLAELCQAILEDCSETIRRHGMPPRFAHTWLYQINLVRACLDPGVLHKRRAIARQLPHNLC